MPNKELKLEHIHNCTRVDKPARHDSSIIAGVQWLVCLRLPSNVKLAATRCHKLQTKVKPLASLCKVHTGWSPFGRNPCLWIHHVSESPHAGQVPDVWAWVERMKGWKKVVHWKDTLIVPEAKWTACSSPLLLRPCSKSEKQRAQPVHPRKSTKGALDDEVCDGFHFYCSTQSGEVATCLAV